MLLRSLRFEPHEGSSTVTNVETSFFGKPSCGNELIIYIFSNLKKEHDKVLTTVNI